jgi:hypothetical protein
MKHNARSVTFSLTAANVNALDGTAITIATFPDDGVIRVPTRLEIRRNSGTAYTVTPGDYPRLRLQEGDVEDSYASGFSGGNFIRVYEGTVGSSSPRTWFQLKAEGFIDVATAQNRIAFPHNASREFKDNVTSLLIEYQGQAIASGTGTVEGTVFFDEYGVTLPMGR